MGCGEYTHNSNAAMQHWTSNIHRWSLSSLAAGIGLALVLRSSGKCAYGFVSAQLLSVWVLAVYRHCVNYMHRSDPGVYVEHNTSFLAESTASAAPRQYVLRERTVVYFGTLSIALGVSDALVAVLPHTSADNYVLLVFAIALGKGGSRLLGVAAMMYCVAVHPLPLAHEMLRPLCLVLPILCANICLPRAHSVLRVTVCATTALLYAAGPCTSIVRAIPPAMVVQGSLFALGANPPLTFIIAGLFT